MIPEGSVTGLLRIIMVRHGETEENAGRVVQGHKPGRLSPTGRVQTAHAAGLIRGERIDAAYSSDLARAWETAQILVEGREGISVIPDPRLREQDFGSLQGGGVQSLLRRMRRQGEDFSTFNPEGGEPAADFHCRVRSFFRHLETFHPGGTVLVVTHFGVFNSFLMEFAFHLTLEERLRHTVQGTALVAELAGERLRRMEVLS